MAAIGFILPEPLWGIPVPEVDVSEWIDEEDYE
jgi:hypothetical protein